MTVPQHRNSHMANQQVDWYQMDSKELFDRNLKESYSVLSRFGWTKSQISYQFNSHGFRCDEFDSGADSLITLGCSHTFGIGLPVDSVWNAMVGDSLKLKNYNLGIGSASNDTAFRMANYYIPLLKPKVVIFLSPDRSRLELATDHAQFENLGVWAFDDAKAFWKHWVTNDINSNMNYMKNQLAIKQICHQHGVKYLHLEMASMKTLDLARDLQHYGRLTHKLIAKTILESL